MSSDDYSCVGSQFPSLNEAVVRPCSVPLITDNQSSFQVTQRAQTPLRSDNAPKHFGTSVTKASQESTCNGRRPPTHPASALWSPMPPRSFNNNIPPKRPDLIPNCEGYSAATRPSNSLHHYSPIVTTYSTPTVFSPHSTIHKQAFVPPTPIPTSKESLPIKILNISPGAVPSLEQFIDAT